MLPRISRRDAEKLVGGEIQRDCDLLKLLSGKGGFGPTPFYEQGMRRLRQAHMELLALEYEIVDNEGAPQYS